MRCSQPPGQHRNTEQHTDTSKEHKVNHNAAPMELCGGYAGASALLEGTTVVDGTHKLPILLYTVPYCTSHMLKIETEK
jgi:hypothetical protein